MQDRYLYRARDRNDQLWHIGWLVWSNGAICYIKNDEGKWLCDANTIGQCTGQKDKNGVLIYEGDFLEVDNLLEIDNHLIAVHYETELGSYVLVDEETTFHGELISSFDMHKPRLSTPFTKIRNCWSDTLAWYKKEKGLIKALSL